MVVGVVTGRGCSECSFNIQSVLSIVFYPRSFYHYGDTLRGVGERRLRRVDNQSIIQDVLSIIAFLTYS